MERTDSLPVHKHALSQKKRDRAALERADSIAVHKQNLEKKVGAADKSQKRSRGDADSHKKEKSSSSHERNKKTIAEEEGDDQDLHENEQEQVEKEATQPANGGEILGEADDGGWQPGKPLVTDASFDTLELSDATRMAITELGFKKLTEIQVSYMWSRIIFLGFIDVFFPQLD